MRTLFLLAIFAAHSVASTLTFETNMFDSAFHSPVVYVTDEIRVLDFHYSYVLLNTGTTISLTDQWNVTLPAGRWGFDNLMFHTATFADPQMIGQSSWSLTWISNGVQGITTGNSLQFGETTPVATPEPATSAMLLAAVAVLAWKKGTSN